MTILEKTYAATAAFVESIPKTQRKRYGQFFTSKMTVEYMAGMFSLPVKTIVYRTAPNIFLSNFARIGKGAAHRAAPFADSPTSCQIKV